MGLEFRVWGSLGVRVQGLEFVGRGLRVLSSVFVSSEFIGFRVGLEFRM